MTNGMLYIVREGDTLATVALAFNVTVLALAAANHLSGSSVLIPGQRLAIPRPSQVLSMTTETQARKAAAPRAGVLGVGEESTPIVSEQEIKEYLAGKRTTYYVTREGDTITSVALVFNTSALVLAQINGVTIDQPLAPGTRLLIPMS